MKRLITGLMLLSTTVLAGEVGIVAVKVECPTSCTFSVTLEHADQGWNHYANQWDVITLDGRLLKSRVLYHPHVDEQPFTRSLSGVLIPLGVNQVKIRARDTQHGYSDQEFIVDLPDRN
ncbi:MAG: hypothetical protein OEO19_03435 [Gammaproteobacteria bacterium]|nr:hypothetical protein [Gammaproteobacteria bacterium]MDH3448935.1 hypothetical protein [Gammaproteobacteria bacterium]